MTNTPASRREGLRLLPLALAAFGLAASLALLAWAWNLRQSVRPYGREELPRLTAVPDFTTTSESGATVTKASLAGKVVIADFIFTTCQGICPGMTAKMKSLANRLRDEPRIRFVSFTVDPVHDTPEVLARYGKEHGADPDRWSFLRTDTESLRRLCREGFRLAVEDAGPGAKEPILHSTRFVLVDAGGTIRGYYDSDEPGAMEALAEGAQRLAREDGARR
ncbi:MAG TPA: SCO family protein [Thermoanaerobaculia bacterium]|nr:SCO family protein [Thermoanaerobaculia bacterium]